MPVICAAPRRPQFFWYIYGCVDLYETCDKNRADGIVGTDVGIEGDPNAALLDPKDARHQQVGGGMGSAGDGGVGNVSLSKSQLR